MDNTKNTFYAVSVDFFTRKWIKPTVEVTGTSITRNAYKMNGQHVWDPILL